jgi:hypothetical protein
MSYWAEEKLSKVREQEEKMKDWKNKAQAEIEKEKKDSFKSKEKK